MGTISDQLSGYGNHFIDVVLMLEGHGKQKHPLSMSLQHFFFCPTISFVFVNVSVTRDTDTQH